MPVVPISRCVAAERKRREQEKIGRERRSVFIRVGKYLQKEPSCFIFAAYENIWQYRTTYPLGAMRPMTNFYSSVIDALKAAKKKFGSATALAEKVGVNRVTLGKWINGEKIPTILEVGKVFDILGVEFEGFRSTEAKDVYFVDAKLVPAAENAAPPRAENYLAVPMVEESAAGPGCVLQSEIKSWLLVYRYQAAVLYRRNLLAVEIGPRSLSMQPTLNPGDIVLVDREDRDASSPGHIMLVLNPLDGGGMIRRVAVKDLKDDFRITYYSDNAEEYPPLAYSLKKNFGGDWEKTIVGRVVWVWANVKGK